MIVIIVPATASDRWSLTLWNEIPPQGLYTSRLNRARLILLKSPIEVFGELSRQVLIDIRRDGPSRIAQTINNA